MQRKRRIEGILLGCFGCFGRFSSEGYELGRHAVFTSPRSLSLIFSPSAKFMFAIQGSGIEVKNERVSVAQSSGAECTNDS